MRSASLANDWQISGIYRWTSGRPYTVNFNIPNIGAANLTGTDGNPNARVVLTCDPGRGWSGDPYQQLDTSCFAPPQPGSDGAESARFFVRSPPINNVDLSLSKNFGVIKGVRFEIRADMFNALNHTQFTGVNSTVNFASLTDRTITNLPYNSSGALVSQNGFGSNQRRGAAALVPDRHADDVLGERTQLPTPSLQLPSFGAGSWPDRRLSSNEMCDKFGEACRAKGEGGGVHFKYTFGPFQAFDGSRQWDVLTADPPRVANAIDHAEEASENRCHRSRARDVRERPPAACVRSREGASRSSMRRSPP